MGRTCRPLMSLANSSHAVATWIASSRVGARISICGSRRVGSRRAKRGNANAAVLPVPVWDHNLDSLFCYLGWIRLETFLGGGCGHIYLDHITSRLHWSLCHSLWLHRRSFSNLLLKNILHYKIENMMCFTKTVKTSSKQRSVKKGYCCPSYTVNPPFLGCCKIPVCVPRSPQGPSSTSVRKQLRKVDLPFRMDVYCIGQPTVLSRLTELGDFEKNYAASNMLKLHSCFVGCLIQ